MPDVDAALVRAAKQGKRDITRQATIYLEEGLEREGLLEAAR